MDALWIRGPLDWTRTARSTCREARGDDDQAYQKYMQEGQGVDDSGQDYQMYMQESQGDVVDASRMPRGCLMDASRMPLRGGGQGDDDQDCQKYTREVRAA